MSKLVAGFPLGPWEITEASTEGGGFRDFRVRHELLGTEAECRVFGSEFGESPEVRRALERFLFALCKVPHPCIRAIYDCGEVPDSTEGSLYLVRRLEEGPSLRGRVRESPLATREGLLPFLQTLAGMLADFQGLRYGPDRLTLGDLSWENRTLSVREVAWSVMMEGLIRRRLPELTTVWEHTFESGVYPLGEKTFPRVESLVKVGHLAYEAAGVDSPDRRILRALETSGSAAALVEGWGIPLESLVRRCLFAHREGMMDSPETLLWDVEKLMAGEIPEGCGSLPELRGPEEARGGRATVAAPEKKPVAEEETEIVAGEAKAPSRAFTPLGAEAAVLDTSGKPKKKKAPARVEKTPRPAVARPKTAGPSIPGLWILIGAGAAAVLLVVVLLVVLLSGGEEVNQPPVAAVVSVPQEVKVLETFELDASASSDPDGDRLTYIWEVPRLSGMDYTLEPNNSTQAVKPTVRFFRGGTHRVNLRVFDGRQYSDMVSFVIDVQER